MQDTQFQGTPPRGASANSGTISATTEITAGDIIINTISFPVVPIPSPATAAGRCDQLVALINSYQSLTGVVAVKVTATTYSLRGGAAIEATLGGTATVATCGFVTSISAALTAVLLATRKVFGSDALTSDQAVVKLGSQEFTVGSAKKMGMITTGPTGLDIEYDVSQTPTRLDP